MSAEDGTSHTVGSVASEDLNLTGVKSLNQALGRTKNGVAAVELANRLGLWTETVHQKRNTRPEFPAALSELTPAQLTDLYSSWTAEFGRLIELCGAIKGQEALLNIQLRSATAAAKARLRRNVAEGEKAPTGKAVDDMAEEDPAVIDLMEQTGLLAVLSAHANAAREATQQFLSTISREITFRDAQMKARIY